MRDAVVGGAPVARPAGGVARHGADVGVGGAGAAELDCDGEGFFGGGCAGGLLAGG